MWQLGNERFYSESSKDRHSKTRIHHITIKPIFILEINIKEKKSAGPLHVLLQVNTFWQGEALQRNITEIITTAMVLTDFFHATYLKVCPRN